MRHALATCLVCLLALLPPRKASQATGIPVLLTHACAPQNIGDGRWLFVRLLPKRELYLNDQLLSESSLRAALRKQMSSRVERIVWLMGDRRLTYGEVVILAATLRADTPDLNIGLITSSQSDGTDPAEPRTKGASHPSNRNFLPCVNAPAP